MKKLTLKCILLMSKIKMKYLFTSMQKEHYIKILNRQILSIQLKTINIFFVSNKILLLKHNGARDDRTTYCDNTNHFTVSHAVAL